MIPEESKLKVSIISHSASNKTIQQDFRRVFADHFDEINFTYGYASDSNFLLIVDVKPAALYKSLVTNPIYRANLEKVLIFNEMEPVIRFIPGFFAHAFKTDPHTIPIPYYYFLHHLDKYYGFKESSGNKRRLITANFLGRINPRLKERVWVFNELSKTKGFQVRNTKNNFPLFNRLNTSYKRVNSSAERLKYLETLRDSKFTLCPSGAGPSSIRIYEALREGSVPILFNDQLELPPIIDSCVLRYPNYEENKKGLLEFINEHEKDWEQLSKKCKESYNLLIKNYYSEIIKGLRYFLNSPFEFKVNKRALYREYFLQEVRWFFKESLKKLKTSQINN